jgi:hypothetical protein
MIPICGGCDAVIELERDPLTADATSVALDGYGPAQDGLFQQCSAAGKAVTIADKAAFTSRLLGRWIFCGGAKLAYPQTFAGFEFLADTRFFQLEKTGQGTIVRSTCSKCQGHWTAHLDTADLEHQVTMKYQVGWYRYWYDVSFLDSTPTVALESHSGKAAYRFSP